MKNLANIMKIKEKHINRIMNIINNQNKKNNSIFPKIPEKIKENKQIYKYPAHVIFLNDSIIKIFTKEYISSLIKNKFKESNDDKYLIEYFSQIFMDLEIKKEFIFFILYYYY